MPTILEKIRKYLEESLDIFKDSANTVFERAEDFGKINKLRYEIRSLSQSAEKKLTLLGDAVFPYLVKNEADALKDNPGIKLVVEEIQDLNVQIEAKQKEIDALVEVSQNNARSKDQEKMQKKILELEKEIEERMSLLNKLKKNETK